MTSDSGVRIRPNIRRRMNFVLPPHGQFDAPYVFDQGHPGGARIVHSSDRFDRQFGGSHELRTMPANGSMYHLIGEMSDTDVREQFSSDHDPHRGVGRFLQVLALADTPDGVGILPPVTDQPKSRLITYLRNKQGREVVVEAERQSDGFALDAYDLDQIVWGEKTFLLSFVPFI